MDSMSLRSFWVWWLIWLAAIASPPARTVTPSRSCTNSSLSVSACCCAPFSPPVMPATIRPVLPSLLTSDFAADGGAVHGEITCATYGELCS